MAQLLLCGALAACAACALASEGAYGMLLRAAAVSGRQVVRGDGHGGEGFVVQPLVEDAPATVVLAHGLDGDGQEWGYVALTIAYLSLNYVRFVLPTAPNRPVTYLSRRANSWYDITLFVARRDDFFYVDEFVACDEAQMMESSRRLDEIVEGEVAAGVPPERIFLLGFSQGGALAYTNFLRATRPLGGLVAVATWLPFQASYPALDSNVTKGSDILVLHGADDDVVLPTWVDSSLRTLRTAGRNTATSPTVIRYAGQGHALVTVRAVDAIEEFVLARAPGETQVLKRLVERVSAQFVQAASAIDARGVRGLPDALRALSVVSVRP